MISRVRGSKARRQANSDRGPVPIDSAIRSVCSVIPHSDWCSTPTMARSSARMTSGFIPRLRAVHGVHGDAAHAAACSRDLATTRGPRSQRMRTPQRTHVKSLARGSAGQELPTSPSRTAHVIERRPRCPASCGDSSSCARRTPLASCEISRLAWIVRMALGPDTILRVSRDLVAEDRHPFTVRQLMRRLDPDQAFP